MHSFPLPEIAKWVLQTLNNLYEIERKLGLHGDPGNVQRNVDRIREIFESNKLFYEDPMGQQFNETRTDLDVSIAGPHTEDLIVIEVKKPIVRYGERALSRVVQKGIVIVESKANRSI
jgi:hypothetical protein